MYTYHTRKLTGKNLKLKLFCDNVFALYSAKKIKGWPLATLSHILIIQTTSLLQLSAILLHSPVLRLRLLYVRSACSCMLLWCLRRR